MCLFPFFSFRKANNVIYNDDLPAYRPVDEEPIQPTSRSYKYTFDIPSAGTMTINARNDGTMIFHHIPTITTDASHGVSHKGIAGDLNDGETLVGMSAKERQDKLDQTKLRLQEARASFQESMDRLNQELTLVKDYDSVTLLEDEEKGGLTGDRLFYKDNDCKDLVKI